MKILITGIPGSGKTLISQEIKKKYPKLKFFIINDKDFSMSRKLGSFDKVTKEYVVDIVKLNKETKFAFNKDFKNTIFEGHLWCELSKKTLMKFDYIFYLDVKEKLLRKRLVERKYDTVKIEENIMCLNTNYIQNMLSKIKIPFHSISVDDDLKLNLNKINKFLRL